MSMKRNFSDFLSGMGESLKTNGAVIGESFKDIAVDARLHGDKLVEDLDLKNRSIKDVDFKAKGSAILDDLKYGYKMSSRELSPYNRSLPFGVDSHGSLFRVKRNGDLNAVSVAVNSDRVGDTDLIVKMVNDAITRRWETVEYGADMVKVDDRIMAEGHPNLTVNLLDDLLEACGREMWTRLDFIDSDKDHMGYYSVDSRSNCLYVMDFRNSDFDMKDTKNQSLVKAVAEFAPVANMNVVLIVDDASLSEGDSDEFWYHVESVSDYVVTDSAIIEEGSSPTFDVTVNFLESRGHAVDSWDSDPIELVISAESDVRESDARESEGSAR